MRVVRAKTCEMTLRVNPRLLESPPGLLGLAQQARDHFRRMLQIRIHDAHPGTLGSLEAFYDRSA